MHIYLQLQLSANLKRIVYIYIYMYTSKRVEVTEITTCRLQEVIKVFKMLELYWMINPKSAILGLCQINFPRYFQALGKQFWRLTSSLYQSGLETPFHSYKLWKFTNLFIIFWINLNFVIINVSSKIYRCWIHITYLLDLGL